MLVTVEDGRAVKVQGDPDHPPTHGALCTKVSRYAERTYHPERVLHPLKRVGAEGQRPLRARGLGRGARRHRGAPAGDRRPDAHAEAIVPYSYAGTMGLLQGESMAARFFHRLGASLLDRTICSSAGGEALAATYGAKVGMHVEHFAESRLILIWGSNSITSNLHFWTYAQAAKRAGAKLVCIDPRRTETADKCHQHIALLPGTDGALALGADARADRQRLARPRLHRAPHRGLAGAARARARSGRRSASRRSAASTPTRCAAWRATTAPPRPAAIRLNYGMQRVRGGGNAVRLIAILPCLVGAWRHRAGGLLLSSSGWFRACATTPRCSGPTCSARAGRARST